MRPMLGDAWIRPATSGSLPRPRPRCDQTIPDARLRSRIPISVNIGKRRRDWQCSKCFKPRLRRNRGARSSIIFGRLPRTTASTLLDQRLSVSACSTRPRTALLAEQPMATMKIEDIDFRVDDLGLGRMQFRPAGTRRWMRQSHGASGLLGICDTGSRNRQAPHRLRIPARHQTGRTG